MKKLIALLIAVMMIATMIPVMAVSTSAAGEGDWTTWRFATEYPSEDDEDDDEEKTYKPAAGYTYTDEGFTIDPADFTDTTPAITVQTKDKVSVKDGIYLGLIYPVSPVLGTQKALRKYQFFLQLPP